MDWGHRLERRATSVSKCKTPDATSTFSLSLNVVWKHLIHLRCELQWLLLIPFKCTWVTAHTIPKRKPVRRLSSRWTTDLQKKSLLCYWLRGLNFSLICFSVRGLFPLQVPKLKPLWAEAKSPLQNLHMIYCYMIKYVGLPHLNSIF